MTQFRKLKRVVRRCAKLKNRIPVRMWNKESITVVVLVAPMASSQLKKDETSEPKLRSRHRSGKCARERGWGESGPSPESGTGLRAFIRCLLPTSCERPLVHTKDPDIYHNCNEIESYSHNGEQESFAEFFRSRQTRGRAVYACSKLFKCIMQTFPFLRFFFSWLSLQITP